MKDRLFILLCGVVGGAALLWAPATTAALAFETENVDVPRGGDSAPFVDSDQLDLVNSLNKSLHENDASDGDSPGLSIGNFHVGAQAYEGSGYLPKAPQLSPDQPGWIFQVAPH